MKPFIVAELILILSVVPPIALGDLILVEDNRFLETNYEGTINRLDSPGASTWEASLMGSLDPGRGFLPHSDQLSTFSASAISGTGQTFTTQDAGTYTGATSTFDVTFRVDRPTLVSLSGGFPAYFIPPFGWVGRLLLFEEDSSLIFSSPSDTGNTFSFQTRLYPEHTYRLFIEASLFEDVDTGAGIDIGHRFEFELEAPELPSVAGVSLVLFAAALRRRATPRTE